MKIKHTTIAIDVMGGDNAPFSVLEGIKIANQCHTDVSFVLCGNHDEICEKVFDFDGMDYKLVNAPKVIKSGDKPSDVLRYGKDTSIGVALQLLANNEVDAVVSAGDTGVLMALSKMILGTIGPVKRPVICGLLPSKMKPVAMLDLGANISRNEQYYLECAIMGYAFFVSNFGRYNCKIGILNIGSEVNKGGPVLAAAHELISASSISKYFIGYVEPSDVLSNNVDIVVTDGFSGNIFLKTLEASLDLASYLLVNPVNAGMWMTSACKLLSPLLQSLPAVDVCRHNGAMLVGLNGIVIKSHGNANGEAFAMAINRGISMVRHNVNDIIRTHIINDAVEPSKLSEDSSQD